MRRSPEQSDCVYGETALPGRFWGKRPCGEQISVTARWLESQQDPPSEPIVLWAGRGQW